VKSHFAIPIRACLDSHFIGRGLSRREQNSFRQVRVLNHVICRLRPQVEVNRSKTHLIIWKNKF